MSTKYNKKWTDEQLGEAVKQSISIAGVLRILGLPITGGQYWHVRNRIKRANIDTSHFLGQGHNKGKISLQKKSKENILVLKKEKSRSKAVQLRRAMIEHGIEYKCKQCEISDWLGNKITLEIDHIDGNFWDNRPENLRFLCPNCHSQQDNAKPHRFSIKIENNNFKCIECNCEISRRAKRCKSCAQNFLNRIRPEKRRVNFSKEELEKLVWEKPIEQIAKSIDVTGNAIRHWCQKYNIQTPPMGYWSKFSKK